MQVDKTWVLIVLLLIPAINVHAWSIPDTGQTKCYNNSTEIPCPAPGEPFYGQDGNYTINLPSYTKLDASGAVLPDTAATWVMVKDNVTGLIWENKTRDGSINDGSKEFTWCDKNTATNGGVQGTCGTGTGAAATDTEDYIKAMNEVKFGGFSDWRMPTSMELMAITDLSQNSPAFNTTWFHNTVSSGYWSSTTLAEANRDAWCISFNLGNFQSYSKSNAHAVRAVRGGQYGTLDHLVINGNGSVTDTATGLMWQQDTVNGKNWQDALAYAEGLSLAGYDDWRLPTVTELQTIVDFRYFVPASDTTFFPGTLSSDYWSSTTYASNDNFAWCADFGYGNVYFGLKADAYAVRAVRGGQSGSFASLVISLSGSGTVSSAPVGIACGSQCMAYFNPGISVTLTAQAASGSSFAGWSGGGCTGTSPCDVTMDTSKSVSAIFNINNPLVANAGSNQVVFNKATLNGSASQGDITSWSWTLTHQTNPAYSRTATGQKPSLDNLAAGFYDVRLTVSDGTSTSAATNLLAVAGIWDVNGDGKLGLAEVVYILQAAAGMR